MSARAAGVLVSTLALVVVAPYLAGVTVSAPDPAQRRWWRPRRVAGARMSVTAGVGVLLGVPAGYTGGTGASLVALVCLAIAGTALCVIDVEHHRLPDRIVAPAAMAGALSLTAAAVVTGDGRALLRAAAAATAVLVALLALAVAARGSFGLGDVKLGAVLGGYLGWLGWTSVYLGILAGFVLGALVATALVLIGRVSMKTAIPFGPMLILGAFAVMCLPLPPGSPR